MGVVKFEDFKLSWLHAFVCVWKLRGYSNAAAYLEVSQPTVTRHVASLEEWFGHTLLTPTKPPRLTNYGESVYRLAERTLHGICDFNHVINRAVRNAPLSAQDIENARPLKAFWLDAEGIENQDKEA